MAMLVLLRRMKRGDLTAHGFRSSFRDWGAEKTSFPNEVLEMALAHAVGTRQKPPIGAAICSNDGAIWPTRGPNGARTGRPRATTWPTSNKPGARHENSQIRTMLAIGSASRNNGIVG